MNLQDFDQTNEILIDTQNKEFSTQIEELIFTHLGTKGEDYWSFLSLFDIQGNDSLCYAYIGEFTSENDVIEELRAGTHVFMRGSCGINDVLTVLNEKGFIDDCKVGIGFNVWW